MADEPDDSSSNGGPSTLFRDVDWAGPGPVIRHGSAQHLPTVLAVDSPVSSREDSPFPNTIGEGIIEGKIRDSLELKKYQPPNPLGVRRRASKAAEAEAALKKQQMEEAGAEPPKNPELATMNNVNRFSLPSTGDRGRENRRRDGPSHALNIVQPYPNPSGFKKRAKPINLGRSPEHLLKRQAPRVSVAYTPDRTPIITKPVAIEPQDGEAKVRGGGGDVQAAAARRFSFDLPGKGLARKIRNCKAGAQQQQQITAKDKGKGKAVQSDEGSMTTEGMAKGKAVSFVEPGESEHGGEHHAAGVPQVDGAAKEGRDGKLPGNAIKAVRKALGVGRYWKGTA